uniref:Major facilitator superfamily (MFS) profile domain-containing protein n=1 Tax=Parascaris univalens TaxID=6257 RepID=A0A915BB15_PARUN
MQTRETNDINAQPPQNDYQEKELMSAEYCHSTHFRYYVLIVATLACSLIISCSFAYNFSLICSVPTNKNERNSSARYDNPSTAVPGDMQKLMYSAYPLSNLLTLPLMAPLLRRFSLRVLTFIGGLVTVICAALMPLLLTIDDKYAVVARFIQGIGNTPLFPLIGFVCAHWCPRNETALFVAVLTSYSQVGIFLTMGVSGVLCNFENGWAYIYYFHSGITLIAFMAWYIAFRDFPRDHPWISKGEMQYIEECGPTRRFAVPYKAVFRDLPFWAVVVAGFGNFNGISPLIVFSTQILHNALGVSAAATGLYNAISFLLQLVLKIAAGVASDRWNAKEVTKLRIFNSLSCGLCGVLMLIMATMQKNYTAICVFLVIVTQGLIGFNSAGFNKAAVVIARQYAHFPMTLIGIALNIGLIVEPFLAYAIAPEHHWNDWKILFILHGSTLIVTNLFFCIFIRGRPSKFTELTFVDK